MAKIQETVTINRPVDAVFDYVTSFDNLTKWELSILESVKTSENAMGIGNTYSGIINMMGMKMKWTSRVTEYEDHRRLDETITSGRTTIYKKEMFEKTDDGNTEFTLVYDYRLGGFLRLISPVLIMSMRMQMKKNLANLKSIMEREG